MKRNRHTLIQCSICGKDQGSNNYARHLKTCNEKNSTFPYPCAYSHKGNTGYPIRLGSEIYSERKGPHKHTVEDKKKISISRIKYLKENPSQVPYLLNHSSRESYPEKYFNQILDKEGIKYDREYQVGLYSLDFALLDKKIALEIDGEQHYVDNRIVQSDIKRTNILEELGWSIIRVRWSHYKKLDQEERTKYIDQLLTMLR